MRRAALVAVVFGVLAAGCGQSAPPATTAAPANPLPAAVSPRQAAHTLAQRGDWAGAVVKYREALRAEPNDALLRFALGSALSHLDRRDEAIEQFQWVVAHGRGGLPEVAAARQWLQQAGMLDPEPSASPATAAAKAVDPRSAGTVAGKTSWPGAGKDSYSFTLQILLAGDDAATQGRTLYARVRLGEPYSISTVPEGRYRLLAQVGGMRLWETRVQVTAGKETVLDLTPDTSAVSPKDFPQRAGS